MRWFLWRVGPPLAVMALIFFLSAQPGLSSGLSWDLYLRKAAHMAVFGVLAVLLWRALAWRRPALAAVVALLYAVSDELHQHWVPDRHGSPVDVLIDGVGIALGLAAAAWLRRRRRRRRVRA